VRWLKKVRNRRNPTRLHDVWNRRASNEGNCKKHHDEDRLGEKPDHPGSARAHRTVRVRGVNRRQGAEETAKRKNKPAAEHVTHEGEEQRIARQNWDEQRNKHRRSEGDIRRRPEYPRTVLGYDFVFMKKFPDVAIRLKDAWSNAWTEESP
jgi:hypothetical protein